MYKILISLLVILSHSYSATYCDTTPINPLILKQYARLVGKEFASGVGESLKEGVGQGAGDIAKEVFKESLKGSMEGLGEAFNNGELAKLGKTIGLDARNGMAEASGEMRNGIDIWGRDAQEAFAKGGEFDRGTKQFFDTNKDNVNSFLNGVVHTNLIKGSAIALGTAGGFFILKYSIPLAFKMIERQLMRPKLIIESYKTSMFQKFKGLFTSAYKPLPIIANPDLKQQLDDTVKKVSVINKKIGQGKTNIKYRNLMLYGPPGTGKTMFAKELARQSGLDYAFMSGSSFSKFKDGEGIEALDELFAWAKRSKGLMIFIDEAETFLSKRENMDPQSKAYQLLNNFLNYTGERSNKFMLVFATNHKNALDEAMYRRIDDLIEMPLPSQYERACTISLYKDKILMDEKQNGKPFVESVKKCFTPAAINAIAEKTKGLSYGDLEGIINAIKTDTDILEPAVVTQRVINTAVDRAVTKFNAFTNGKTIGTVID